MLNEPSISLEDFNRLQNDWSALVRKAGNFSVFALPEWQRMWWATFSGNADLRLLALRRSHRLEAVFPLMQRGEELCFLGDTDLVDYHEIPHLNDSADNFQALIDFLIKDPSWRVMRLESVPGWDRSIHKLKTALDTAGLSYQIDLEDRSPGIMLPGSWDAFLATLPAKQRHELCRKLRRIHKAGQVSQQIVSEPKDVNQCLDDFFVLMRKSLSAKDAFLTPARQSFLHRAITELACEGLARLYLLTLDGRLVAGSVVFVVNDRHYAYNSGFDPALGSLSVGIVNHALAIRRAISEGAVLFDFMRGDETYKYRLGAKDRLIYRLVVTRDSVMP